MNQAETMVERIVLRVSVLAAIGIVLWAFGLLRAGPNVVY